MRSLLRPVSRPGGLRRALVLGALLLLRPSSLFGQVFRVKLSGSMAGDVEFVAVSPDSRRAVYVADERTSGVYELFSVAISGNETRRLLSAALPPGGDVTGSDPVLDQPPRISPDGRFVVYRADQGIDDVFELYSVPIDGSEPPTRLNAALPPGSDVSGVRPAFDISADSAQVLYLADQEEDEVFSLYRVPIEGGAPPQRVHPPPVAGGDVLEWTLSGDGRWVVYRADSIENERFELFSASLENDGAPLRISGTLVPGGDVQEFFAISPDSSRVIYLADQDTDEVTELYSVPIDGSANPVRLNGALADGGDVVTNAGLPQISADGHWVVYRAEETRNGSFDLRSVAIDASGPRHRIDRYGRDFRISPDSRHVLWGAQDEPFPPYDLELFSSPIDRSDSRIRLNGPKAEGGDVFNLGFLFAPDGARVIYRADETTDEVVELYSVPTDASESSFRINAPLVPGGDVSLEPHSLWITPDSSRAIYVADQEVDGRTEIYATSLESAAEIFKINGPLVSGGDAPARFPYGLVITPDSSATLYIADQDVDETRELYAAHFEIPECFLVVAAHGSRSRCSSAVAAGCRAAL